ncbi:right-handed parallel beta-helix repeat-containing protein [Aureibaculum sp. 2210JD6-5]|uniref:right-handed parallel beta-helix repeat-containing protein n=1 Tax=Aureibaculum sp. 2210JD6-5 TaxID=3103957 RepID=UPI002AAD092F|nr:right-handed parallel beta-helix repeat-containing protein [Aureibaculum sp. 2210JD6-5]MDY7394510.1 right-handed parallel beta-helix repeat-containing protein [Aureibaculum sp. 2210JD6-5]
MKIVLKLIIIFFTYNYGIAQDITTIYAKDYGIIPNTFIDIAPQLKKVYNDLGKYDAVKLIFEEGRYDIYPDQSEQREYFISNTSTEKEVPSKIKTIALLFENAKDLTIEGNGALFVIHGKMINFAFDHCENITIQNVSFDYERPTMSELTFNTVNDTEVVATINPDSKYAIIDNKLKFYGDNWTINHHHAIAIDTTLSAFYYSNFTPLLNSEVTQIKPFTLQFKGDFPKSGYKKGMVLTVRDPIRDQVGAFIGYSKNVVLKNVKVHYMHGMGVISQFNENVTLDSVIVKPREETGRRIAAFADCFHFSGCKGQITIKNSETYGGHDDAINIHGTHLKITEKIANDKIKLRFMHGQTYGMKAFFVGDTLAFVHAKSLQKYGSGKVKSVEKLTDREILVTLEKSMPKEFKLGDVVENLTWTPSVTIKDNYFSGTNTRGILLTTQRKSIIENNTFFRTGMHAILIANDASSWYESGAVKDVTIRNNRFVDCAYNQIPGNYIINIWPENHQLVKNFYVHENITIENNIFETFDTPILRAKSTNGLVFRNNKIIKTDTFKDRRGGKPSFHIENSKNVKVELQKSDTNNFDDFNLINVKKKRIKVNRK